MKSNFVSLNICQLNLYLLYKVHVVIYIKHWRTIFFGTIYATVISIKHSYRIQHWRIKIGINSIEFSTLKNKQPFDINWKHRRHYFIRRCFHWYHPVIQRIDSFFQIRQQHFIRFRQRSIDRFHRALFAYVQLILNKLNHLNNNSNNNKLNSMSIVNRYSDWNGLWFLQVREKKMKSDDLLFFWIFF